MSHVPIVYIGIFLDIFIFFNCPKGIFLLNYYEIAHQHNLHNIADIYMHNISINEMRMHIDK